MSIVLGVLGGVLGWLAGAAALGVLIGRAIRLADQRNRLSTGEKPQVMPLLGVVPPRPATRDDGDWDW